MYTVPIIIDESEEPMMILEMFMVMIIMMMMNQTNLHGYCTQNHNQV